MTNFRFNLSQFSSHHYISYALLFQFSLHPVFSLVPVHTLTKPDQNTKQKNVSPKIIHLQWNWGTRKRNVGAISRQSGGGGEKGFGMYQCLLLASHWPILLYSSTINVIGYPSPRLPAIAISASQRWKKTHLSLHFTPSRARPNPNSVSQTERKEKYTSHPFIFQATPKYTRKHILRIQYTNIYYTTRTTHEIRRIYINIANADLCVSLPEDVINCFIARKPAAEMRFGRRGIRVLLGSLCPCVQGMTSKRSQTSGVKMIWVNTCCGIALRPVDTDKIVVDFVACPWGQRLIYSIAFLALVRGH